MLSAAPTPIATGFSCRDQDHRRALQSLLSGKLPRADRHHLGLRRGLNAILPDGRAAARGVDEAVSRRAPGGMALRDRQTGWQGSLGWKATFPESSGANPIGAEWSMRVILSLTPRRPPMRPG